MVGVLTLHGWKRGLENWDDVLGSLVALPPIPQNLSDEVPFRKDLWKRIRSLEVTFCYVCMNFAKKSKSIIRLPAEAIKQEAWNLPRVRHWDRTSYTRKLLTFLSLFLMALWVIAIKALEQKTAALLLIFVNATGFFYSPVFWMCVVKLRASTDGPRAPSWNDKRRRKSVSHKKA